MDLWVEEIWLGLDYFYSVYTLTFLLFCDMWDWPILTHQHLISYFIFIVQFLCESPVRVIPLTIFHFCDLYLFFSLSDQPKLARCDLIESAIIKIMFKLQIYIFPMTWILRIIEVIGSNKDPLHKLVRYSLVRHQFDNLYFNYVKEDNILYLHINQSYS